MPRRPVLRARPSAGATSMWLYVPPACRLRHRCRFTACPAGVPVFRGVKGGAAEHPGADRAAVDGPAAADHLTGRMGRGRVDQSGGAGLPARWEDQGGRGAPHHRVQRLRLRRRPEGGPRHLRVPRQAAGLEGRRLQLPRRQVRRDPRGPQGRNRPARPGRTRLRLQRRDHRHLRPGHLHRRRRRAASPLHDGPSVRPTGSGRGRERTAGGERRRALGAGPDGWRPQGRAARPGGRVRPC